MTILGGLLALLAAVLYPFVRHIVIVGGLLETFVNENQEGCTLIQGRRIALHEYVIKSGI